jgi:outer membrane protein OmpA-like peptidoglycan-associated protein
MKRILLTSLVCAGIAYPAAAFAQAQPTRSVDDYLCAFAGKCDEEPAEEVTKDAPETKGFSLARPGASKDAPETKGFSLARPDNDTRKPATRGFKLATTKNKAAPAEKAAAPKAAVATKPTKAKKDYASAPKASKAVAKAAAADEKRADLRLSFQLGSADLTPQAMEEAKVFAESMKRPELASMKFRIEGHTDAQGNRAYNLDLSQRRAQAVADYLQSLGVAADRLEVRGYGFDKPLSGYSATAEENRRVEAVLTS